MRQAECDRRDDALDCRRSQTDGAQRVDRGPAGIARRSCRRKSPRKEQTSRRSEQQSKTSAANTGLSGRRSSISDRPWRRSARTSTGTRLPSKRSAKLDRHAAEHAETRRRLTADASELRSQQAALQTAQSQLDLRQTELVRQDEAIRAQHQECDRRQNELIAAQARLASHAKSIVAEQQTQRTLRTEIEAQKTAVELAHHEIGAEAQISPSCKRP